MGLVQMRCPSSTAQTWTCLGASWPASSWLTTPNLPSALARWTLLGRWESHSNCDFTLQCVQGEDFQPSLFLLLSWITS